MSDIASMNEVKICRRCNQPVTVNGDSYEVFEKMHWLCFHLEFEHEGDPDQSCKDPSCPWWHIEVYKNKLNQLGQSPEKVIEEAIKEKWRL